MNTLKLNKLVNNQLNDKELCKIVGGETESLPCCTCSCAYENQGGASTYANAGANQKEGLYSKTGIPKLGWCEGVGWVKIGD